jgi:hypothetical protein
MAADAAGATVRFTPVITGPTEALDASGVLTPSLLSDLADAASLVSAAVNVLTILNVVRGGGSAATTAADK